MKFIRLTQVIRGEPSKITGAAIFKTRQFRLNKDYIKMMGTVEDAPPESPAKTILILAVGMETLLVTETEEQIVKLSRRLF